MLLKTTIGLAYLASMASATFFPVMPKCWKKCARESGLMCQWGDLACLCKAANNGFLVKANTCACNTCEDWEFGNDHKAKIDIKEFAFACKMAKTPLADEASSAAFQAATCEGTSGPPSPHSPPSSPPPPPPPPPPAPPVVPYESKPWPVPSAPPAASWPQPAGSLSPSFPFSPSTTLTISVPPKPTWGPSGPPAAPPVVVPPPYTKPAPVSISVSAPPSWTQPTVVVPPVLAPSGPSATVVISQTVMVSPMPLGGSHSASATSPAPASSSKAGGAASSKSSAKPSQFTGVASRSEAHFGASIFAFAAILAYYHIA